MKRFSVVVNTYNRDATLGNTLESLRYQRHDNFEVVVVNGPSTDSTERILQKYSPHVRIGNCPETNISKSRNIGIEMAQGEFIAFLDDDAVPELNWLQNLEQHYHAEERLGGVGGFVRDPSGVSYQCKYIVCDRYGDAQFYDNSDTAYIKQTPGSPKYYSLIGVNSSFRRKALLEIGGFDDEYAYFLDETDVCARLTDAGWLIQHVPHAEVYHNFCASHLRDKHRVPKSLYYVARSKTYFAFRHALPSTTTSQLLTQAVSVRNSIHDQAKHFYRSEMITADHFHSLVNDGERGFSEGITDGYTYPEGKTMLNQPNNLSKYDESSFKRLVPNKEAPERERLILITQDYPPRACGGVGVFIHNLAVGLANQGHEVSVITRGEGEHTVAFEDGVWVHRIKETNHEGRQHPQLPDLPANIKNYAYSVYDEAIRIQSIRGANKTIASIWDLESAGCVASTAFENVVYLVTTYKLSLPSKPEWQKNAEFLQHHVGKVIEGERWILKNCQQIIASTPGILRDVESEYGIAIADRTPIIPFGIPSVGEKHSNGLPAKKVLFVGRLEKRKGVHVLLECIPRLLQTHPNVEFQLVGNDQILVDGTTLKSAFHQSHPHLADDPRVTFFGQVPNATLESLYRDCDLFVAPSLYESFGLIYLEAMRYGKPCIGTNVGGIPDVLDEEYGVMVTPDNAQELEKAIADLLADPQRCSQMGKKGKEAFLSRYSLDCFVRSMEAHLGQAKVA